MRARVLALTLVSASPIGGTQAMGNAATAAPTLTIPEIEAALTALRGADLVVVDDPFPGRAPSALVATRVAVAPAALAAVLGDPHAYREAIPSLVRADIVGRRDGAGGGGEQLLLEWELEIPLFNLKGKAWVAPRAGGVDLILTEGDLAPGKLSFRWAAASSGSAAAAASASASGSTGSAILTLECQANMRAAGWLFRRVASHSPFGEGAMNVAAAYVVVRAAAARAEHPGDAAARRPHDAPVPPPPSTLTSDSTALGEAIPAWTAFRRRGAVASVRRAPSGRLAAAAVAVPIALDAEAIAARLSSPSSWLAFPGWHRVKPMAGDRAAVDDNLPLVDLDAVWQLRRDRRRGFTATVTDGATRGAMFGWDVGPSATGDPRASLAVLSLYPRLDTAGYVPRKLIAAEPLLEHGMALALAYVDAMSMARALSPPATR